MPTGPTSDRWHEIDDAFDRALGLDPSDVDAFLAKLSDVDEALRAEVLALLKADRRAHEFLGRSASRAAARQLAAALREGHRSPISLSMQGKRAIESDPDRDAT